MKRQLLAISIATVFASIASPALADVTYTYQSQPLDNVLRGSGVGTLTMSFTFNDAGTEVLDWWANHDVIGYLSKADTHRYTFGLLKHLATNEAGEVIEWYADRGGYQSSGWLNGAVADEVRIFPPPGQVYALYVAKSTTPGTWSSDGVLRNLNYLIPSPVPEPSSWGMILGGLGLLTLRKFRSEA